ncbi:hypothetical protein Tco_1023873 [Tanacetum coccineum]
MMTARKRVKPLPVQHLAMRHSVDHSSLDYFSPDDSVQDSFSDSSSEASSDFHSDASSDSSLRHSLSDHSSPDLPSTFARASRKRRRSTMASVPALPLVSGALSPICADLIPSPKRVRDSGYLADVEVDPSEVRLGVDVEDKSFEQSRSRGTDLEVDDDVEGSEESYSELEIDLFEAVIEACFDFADIIRASGVDVRVEVVTVARDDVKTSVRDPIVVSDDRDTPPLVPEVIPEPTQEERAVIKGVQREQGHRIVRVESAVTALTKRIAELERNNKRLRGTASVESQRVDRFQRGMKRVGPLPTHRLVVRHSADHSSSDSSSKASSDFHLDASSDPSSRYSLSDHSSLDLPSTSAGSSCKRRRSPMTFVPALSPVSGALSPIHADLIPSTKRVKDSGYLADVEVDPRETSLRDDAIVKAIDRDETETGVRGPFEVRVERVTHPVMPEDIPEPVQEGAVEATYETLGYLVQRFHDHTRAISVHRIQTIKGIQREQGHRMVGVKSAVIALTERIAELKRDNMRLRDTASVENQRVDRLQRGMSHVQREKMPNTRSGASMTREEFEELVNRRVAEEMEAREAARTLEPLNEDVDEPRRDNE